MAPGGLVGSRMGSLTAVAVGSAPGELPGRGVAGCCASGGDVPHGDQAAQAALPVLTGADRPANGVGRP